MKIDGADEGCNWVKRGSAGSGRGVKEGVGNVTGDENPFDTQVDPSGK